MTDHINTQGFTKAQILSALWNKAKPLTTQPTNQHSFTMTPEEAQKEIHAKSGSYFETVRGRTLNVELRDDTSFDPKLYDQINGPGTAKQAIESLRA